MSNTNIEHTCGHRAQFKEHLSDDIVSVLRECQCGICTAESLIGKNRNRTARHNVGNQTKTTNKLSIIEILRIWIASHIIGKKLWKKMGRERKILIKWLEDRDGQTP